MKKIEESSYKQRPDVKVGDTVKLYLKVKEGAKERVQIFQGVVISMKGSGLNTNLVVRKISYGVGVEKIIPLHAPVLQKIEIIKRGSVRKSKLFYLRDRVGKRALKVNRLKDIYLTDEQEIQNQEEVKEELVEEEVVVEETKKEEEGK